MRRMTRILLPGLMMITQTVMNIQGISPEGRIFDGIPNYEFSNIGGFSETLFYDVRYDLPEDIIRNKRDSRFAPGNQPAGVKGITKELLEFIKDRVNPLGFEIDEVTNKLEDEYSNTIVEEYEIEYF